MQHSKVKEEASAHTSVQMLSLRGRTRLCFAVASVKDQAFGVMMQTMSS